MNVTFTRTGARRYSVSIEGPDIDPATMDPAPGYHDRLPHDAAHFIVENEFGILGGIFGQMSQGGILTPVDVDSRKRRRAKKKRETIFKANYADALFSEHAVYAAQSRWEKQAIIPDTKIPSADIERICSKFDEFAKQWSALPVGGSLTLEWKHSGNAVKRRH